jgi:type IV secretion system protein VirB3
MRERIYKGATRPAMVLGVPLRVLVPVGLPLVLVLIWGSWVYGWPVFMGTSTLMAVLFCWARAITEHDDQRLFQVWKAFRLQLLHRNRWLWKCRSYSPTRYQDAYDEWFK